MNDRFKVRRQLVLTLTLCALSAVYLMSIFKHDERAVKRVTEQALTPNCQAKLAEYELKAGPYYISPFMTKQNGYETKLKGYTHLDILSIERGCNLVDDYHGWHAENGDADRWDSTRYIRTEKMNCVNCHRNVGDWKDPETGDNYEGSMGLAVSWTNSGDTYDIFTGILLMPELRYMQCGINSMNGFKPNVADDILRDYMAYIRFVAAATGKKMGVRYPEQGSKSIPPSDTLKHGDDYSVGKVLYNEKCAACHGMDGRGKRVSQTLVYPALGGPDSFNTDSRNYFALGIFAGIIHTNMPLGQEMTLTPDESRAIGAYIHTFPRPAGDKKGVLAALRQQALMFTMPRLLKLLGRYE